MISLPGGGEVVDGGDSADEAVEQQGYPRRELAGRHIAADLSVTLRTFDPRIEVHASGAVRRITREQIVGVFREGDNIVIEGDGGRKLFRGDVEGGRSVVREAFVSRGYPWEAE